MNKEKLKGILNSRFVKLSLIIIFILSAVSLFSISAVNAARASSYRETISQCESELSRVKEEISSAQSIINGNGIDEYCESVAREKYSYAHTGEYILYDSSYGK